jgi:hypothetical protein
MYAHRNHSQIKQGSGSAVSRALVRLRGMFHNFLG